MKKIHVRGLFLSAALCALLSCQTKTETSSGPGNSGKTAEEIAQAKTRHEIIREEKRKQSEADLPYRGLDPSKNVHVIAFGSGLDQDAAQPIWNSVVAQNPDLFILNGNSISFTKTTPRPLADQYRGLNRVAGYRMAREKIPFLVTWDDHDFGQPTEGGAGVPKDVARKEFVKYWSYLRWSLPGNERAVNHSKMIGDKKNLVQVIMLDTKWDRSEFKRNAAQAPTLSSGDASAPLVESKAGPYIADEDKSKRILSDDQWSWLDHELRRPAALRLLVSPLPFLANDQNFAKWGLFPKERDRLLNLLKNTKAKNVVILSSSREGGAIAKLDIKGAGSVVEVTTGSMNRPTSSQSPLQDSLYVKEAYAGNQFGLMKVDWASKSASIEIRSAEGTSQATTSFKF